MLRPPESVRAWLSVWRSYRLRSKMPGTGDALVAALCGMRAARREIKALRALRGREERKYLAPKEAR